MDCIPKDADPLDALNKDPETKGPKGSRNWWRKVKRAATKCFKRLAKGGAFPPWITVAEKLLTLVTCAKDLELGTLNDINSAADCAKKLKNCDSSRNGASLLQLNSPGFRGVGESLAELTDAELRRGGHLAKRQLSASERRLVLGSVTAAIDAVLYWLRAFFAFEDAVLEAGQRNGAIANSGADEDWVQLFQQYQSDASADGILLSSAEAADLLARAPSEGNRSAQEYLLQRINNTAYANSLGVLSRADAVAQGLPENMIDYYYFNDNQSLYEEREQQALTLGFESLADAIVSSFEDLDVELQRPFEGICATVRISIVQELVLTRQAFEGILEIGNSAGSPMEEIVLTIFIEDGDFNDVDERFAIGEPTPGGEIVLQSPAGAANGSVQTMAMLAAGGQGTLSILIIPRREAAPSRDPRSYRVAWPL